LKAAIMCHTHTNSGLRPYHWSSSGYEPHTKKTCSHQQLNSFMARPYVFPVSSWFQPHRPSSLLSSSSSSATS
jgi:hypothetical protein